MILESKERNKLVGFHREAHIANGVHEGRNTGLGEDMGMSLGRGDRL